MSEPELNTQKTNDSSEKLIKIKKEDLPIKLEKMSENDSEKNLQQV